MVAAGLPQLLMARLRELLTAEAQDLDPFASAPALRAVEVSQACTLLPATFQLCCTLVAVPTAAPHAGNASS